MRADGVAATELNGVVSIVNDSKSSLQGISVLDENDTQATVSSGDIQPCATPTAELILFIVNENSLRDGMITTETGSL